MDDNPRPTIIYPCQTPSGDYNGLSVSHQFPDVLVMDIGGELSILSMLSMSVHLLAATVVSHTKHVWYSEHGTYCRFEIILERAMRQPT